MRPLSARRRPTSRASPDDPSAVAAAVGLLRAGAPPEAAWLAAGLAEIDPDGAPRGAPAGIRASARLARATGSPLVPLVEAVVAQLEAGADAAARAEAGMGGARLSARLLGWLPAVGVAFSAAIDPASLSMVREPWGIALVAIAALLALAGRRWLTRMTVRATAPPSVEDDAVGLALALLDASVASGADVAGALASVGASLAPDAPRAGAGLSRAGQELRAGTRWEDAWTHATEDSPSLRVVEETLRWAWRSGAAPRPALAAARRAEVRRAAAAREVAVSQLSVRAALPLSLCLLPSFVLVGVVPMLIAVARSGGLVP